MIDWIAALPMYDWPERRADVDAEWAALRDRLRAAGVDAPQGLTRSLDEKEVWRHPRLLFAQTCWGPLEQGLAEHVQVIGQPGYDGIEGGEGELYSSAIVMRSNGQEAASPRRPPSVLTDISPSRGEIAGGDVSHSIGAVKIAEDGADGMISPLEGEMSGRTEGGLRREGIPINLLRNTRFAYNGPDSMSGLVGLTRDLVAMGESLAIFSERIESGGHRISVQMVAAGLADVAAIDCRSWAMARQFEAAAQKLHVVGWTKKRLGLPFITAKSTPADIVAELRAALRDQAPPI